MILLDTHVLVWASLAPERLGDQASRRFEQAWAGGGQSVGVSAVSFWEVAMLVAKGRLHLEQSPMQWRRTWLAAGLAEWPLSGAIGIGAVHLDGLHGDPADRWIVATALDLGAELLTADERLLAWLGPLTCVDARR